MRRNGLSTVAAVAHATLLLVGVAIATHVVYQLLAPVLPSLLAIGFVVGLAYWLLLRR